ncbi:hypothetical protein [Collimonas silvisoli]|uniref:hypothetical protein n=1 Tax=Collimonas silvisoli TaxID=2825884 RepID=UPI001E2E4A53|nr:hypothetical protein [Collimonas silvisoli]
MRNLKVERPNYFTGEALLTDDFRCEQQYQMDMLAANNTGLYIYGIAQGLEVSMPTASDGGAATQLEVARGMAIDALGRQIILLQPAVVPLKDLDPGATYFVTINYHEVFADYSDVTGTAGYKRIVQQPEIKALRNLDQPGLYIVLAVISLTTQGGVNSLTYKSGRNERRYVGSSVGSVNFVTEGSGVNPNLPASPPDFRGAKLFTDYASISAKREGMTGSNGNNSADYYLEFDAPRGQFMGLLTTRSNFGVGTDHPIANLQIDAVTFKGKGTISWKNQLVTFTDGPSPFLQVGDILISDPSVGQGAAQRRIVTSIVQLGTQVMVDAAFSPVVSTSGSGYTYIRSTLARFSVTSDTSLLQVNVDGSIGLGKQASVSGGTGSAGPNALTITADRRVGIGLTSGTPQAALDVNGQILATSLISSGAIKAQSFEGNGSKLEGMAMLSYWTKETPGAAASKLYYNSGNVGILDTNPIASLSVGGGHAFIGHGVISSVSNNIVVGNQTTFQDQIMAGDRIAIGTLIEQRATVAVKPTSNTELTLQTQFEVPVIQSPYSYVPQGGSETTGGGTVTSNGTAITGVGTTFTDLNAGDILCIPRFIPTVNAEQGRTVTAVASDTALTLASAYAGTVAALSYSVQAPGGTKTAGAGTLTSDGTAVTGSGTAFLSTVKAGDILFTNPVNANSGLPQKWTVKSIESQTQLTLQPPGNGKTLDFAAATSVYMVTTGLLGQFKANDNNAIVAPDVEAAQAPAMLIVTNSGIANPNTVAINVDRADVDHDCALQVVGDLKVSDGGVDFEDVTADTVWAQRSLTVGGTALAAGGAVMTVAPPASANPLLVVTPTNVLLGQASSTADAMLAVAGNIQASANITAAGNVQGTNLVGDLLGARTVYTQSNLPISVVAASDGLVMAIVGQPGAKCFGVLSGLTENASGVPTSSMFAIATIASFVTGSGKSSGSTDIPIPGSFTMPVRNGETWTLSLTTATDFLPAAPVSFWWVPLGASTQSSTLFSSPSPPPPQAMATDAAIPVASDERVGEGMEPADAASLPANPASVMMDALARVQEQIRAGGMSYRSAQVTQQTINERVSDLAQIFGNATDMSADENDRAQFIRDLQKIVCSPAAPGQPADKQVSEQDVQDLIATFGKVSGHDFTQEQRALLTAGVQALMQINDSAASRNDLNLIKKNIGLFIDNVQQVLGKQFSSGDQRLLTRALVRLVGDGRQNAGAVDAANDVM